MPRPLARMSGGQLAVSRAAVPELFAEDREHPSAAGTYLAACVIYGALFRESPEGIPYAPEGVSQEAAAALQGSTEQFNRFHERHFDFERRRDDAIIGLVYALQIGGFLSAGPDGLLPARVWTEMRKWVEFCGKLFPHEEFAEDLKRLGALLDVAKGGKVDVGKTKAADFKQILQEADDVLLFCHSRGEIISCRNSTKCASNSSDTH